MIEMVVQHRTYWIQQTGFEPGTPQLTDQCRNQCVFTVDRKMYNRTVNIQSIVTHLCK